MQTGWKLLKKKMHVAKENAEAKRKQYERARATRRTDERIFKMQDEGKRHN